MAPCLKTVITQFCLRPQSFSPRYFRLLHYRMHTNLVAFHTPNVFIADIDSKDAARNSKYILEQEISHDTVSYILQSRLFLSEFEIYRTVIFANSKIVFNGRQNSGYSCSTVVYRSIHTDSTASTGRGVWMMALSVTLSVTPPLCHYDCTVRYCTLSIASIVVSQ